MKGRRKLTTLLLTAVLLVLTSLTVLALPSGGYVPTKGTYSYYDKSTKKWVKSNTMTWSYKSDGRLTKRTEKSDSYASTDKFTWSGNRIKKVQYGSGDYVEYKYKGKKLSSVTYFEYNGDDENEDEDEVYHKTTIKLKWKRNKAVIKYGGGSGTYYMNSKGQLTKWKGEFGRYTWIATYQYYANGNMKKVKANHTRSYNRAGYITKDTNEYGHTAKYKYKKKNGKIKQVTVTYSDGSKGKYVFSKWKRVSHVRNCDASGWVYGLLPGPIYASD